MILQNYNAKLSDFGLAKDGPTGDKSHVSTRVMGTYGYAAPEYLATGMDECTCPLISNLVNVNIMFSESVLLITNNIVLMEGLDKPKPRVHCCLCTRSLYE